MIYLIYVIYVIYLMYVIYVIYLSVPSVNMFLFCLVSLVPIESGHIKQTAGTAVATQFEQLAAHSPFVSGLAASVRTLHNTSHER